MDRQDIDALLIGALYGELTPADEARLHAHLESHPTDRGALDGLKSARRAVHESRIFELQLDPPQAVSALLLQEAHRRAPKAVAARDEHEGWFMRFARSFMSHPAMAAAAMLVLVVGVAGTLYIKKGEDFAEKRVSMPSAPAETETADNAPAGQVALQAPIGGGEAAGSSAPTDELRAAEGAYKADLYESREAGLRRELEQLNTEKAKLSEKLSKESVADKMQRDDQDQLSAAPTPAKKNKGIAVATEQMQPKELDRARAKDATGAKKSGALSFGDGEAPTAGYRGMGGGGAAGNSAGTGSIATGSVARAPSPSPAGAAPGAGPYAQPPPPPAQVATADDLKVATPSTTPAKPKPTATATTTKKPADSPKVAEAKSEAKPEAKPDPKAEPTKPASKTAVAKAPPRAADAPAPAAPAEPKRDESNLVAWAKAQHQQTIAFVKKGECAMAAKVALGVSNRAPDYYAQFMATDRALKQCKQYIDNERDKDAEKSAKSRAQKRVNADEPALNNAK